MLSLPCKFQSTEDQITCFKLNPAVFNWFKQSKANEVCFLWWHNLVFIKVFIVLTSVSFCTESGVFCVLGVCGCANCVWKFQALFSKSRLSDPKILHKGKRTGLWDVLSIQSQPFQPARITMATWTRNLAGRRLCSAAWFQGAWGPHRQQVFGTVPSTGSRGSQKLSNFFMELMFSVLFSVLSGPKQS